MGVGDFFRKVGGGIKDGYNAVTGAFDRGDNEFRGVDPYGDLAGQSQAAGSFAGAGERLNWQSREQMQGVADQLGRQMRGEESLSAEQLRQGLQQNRAAQMSAAAGARPGNAAMMARNAANNMGRLGAALSGQQAMAGIQERAAAANSLGGLLGNMRGQDLQAALGARGQAIGGYGALEQARTGRFGALAGVPTGAESIMGAGMGVGSLIAMSDKRLKEGIADGDDDAKAFLDGLKAYRFRYVDEKHGGGEQLGIMAQDLAKTRLGKQAVIETDEGLAVNGAKLATALAAATSSMNRRLEKLEGK